MSVRPKRLLAIGAATLALLMVAPATSAWAVLNLEFSTPPALPTLPSVTLNGRAQTVNTTMIGFAVSDTRLLKSGWNITVAGQSGSGKSPVLAQYCPKAKCGTDAEGYVPGGQTLPAGSLSLNSSGAKFSGGIGGAPTLECSTGCNVDSATAVKIASAASGGPGEGTWTTGGWSATSLSLTAPTTLRALSNEEIYRLDVLWTLSSGP